MEDTPEGTEFLKAKYDLHKSPEVDTAARRTQIVTGEKVPQDPAARIQNYLDRLDNIINPKPRVNRPDSKRKDRNLGLLRHGLYDAHIIKPKEIPEGYWENQRRVMRERGQGADLENVNWQTIVDQNTEVIIADQKSSLDNWVNYLASPDAKVYPNWLKYWSIRSIVGMGEYDKEKKQFGKRSKGTTKPFPDLNREALSVVLDAVKKKYQGQNATFAGLEEQSQEQWDKLLQGENFAKLYAFAIDKVTPATDAELKSTAGQWVKYGQGSDHTPLFESLQGHGTGWCTAGESTAQAHLVMGDFYVFYSKDTQGNSTVPRAAIRMEEDRIAEVRGVAKEQNLDAFIAPVVQAKLQEFPDGKAYEKRVADMMRLTKIEHQSKDDQPLTKEELIFLYEVNSPIEGFGYEKDPRIEKLRATRNPKEDAPFVLDCRPDQIAWSQGEITEETNAYIGPLFKDFFIKYQHLDHIYTSFPEGQIVFEDLEIGGKTKKDLEEEMREKGVEIYEFTQDMIDSDDFTTLDRAEVIRLVHLKVRDLGFTRTAKIDELLPRADEYGLDKVPAETGPCFRLAYMDQKVGDHKFMGMKPILDRYRDPGVFSVGRHGDRRWLSSYLAYSGYGWAPDDRFVFLLRKSADSAGKLET